MEGKKITSFLLKGDEQTVTLIFFVIFTTFLISLFMMINLIGILSFYGAFFKFFFSLYDFLQGHSRFLRSPRLSLVS